LKRNITVTINTTNNRNIYLKDAEVFLLFHVYDDLLLSTVTTVPTPSGELSVRKRRK